MKSNVNFEDDLGPDTLTLSELSPGRRGVVVDVEQTGPIARRLFDLGMHPNSIAAELLAVFAQRLARRICGACRAPHEPDRSLLREVFPRGAPADFAAYRGEGCDQCRGYGTGGRVCVGEYLPSTRELRLAISHHAPLDELRERAIAAGLRSMRSEALDLVQQGTIALEELPRLFTVELLRGWEHP